MIDPKIIRSKPALSAQVNNNAGIALADSAVQTRAYELRGRTDGRAEQDWYQAENDLRAHSQQVTAILQAACACPSPGTFCQDRSVHSLGCGFSGGTIRNRSEASRFEARVASWDVAPLNLVRGVPCSDFSRCSLENLQ